MTPAVLIALGSLQTAILAAYAIKTWADIQVRRCECSEHCAALEYGQPAKQAPGFKP